MGGRNVSCSCCCCCCSPSFHVHHDTHTLSVLFPQPPFFVSTTEHKRDKGQKEREGLLNFFSFQKAPTTKSSNISQSIDYGSNCGTVFGIKFLGSPFSGLGIEFSSTFVFQTNNYVRGKDCASFFFKSSFHLLGLLGKKERRYCAWHQEKRRYKERGKTKRLYLGSLLRSRDYHAYNPSCHTIHTGIPTIPSIQQHQRLLYVTIVN